MNSYGRGCFRFSHTQARAKHETLERPNYALSNSHTSCSGIGLELIQDVLVVFEGAFIVPLYLIPTKEPLKDPLRRNLGYLEPSVYRPADEAKARSVAESYSSQATARFKISGCYVYALRVSVLRG